MARIFEEDRKANGTGLGGFGRGLDQPSGLGGFGRGLGQPFGDLGSDIEQLVGLGVLGSRGFGSLGGRVKPSVPLLGSVAPPRGTVRSKKPFDFFGTLFTTPGTQGLNPIALLNQATI